MRFEVTKKPIDIETNSRIIYIEVMILLIMNYTGAGSDKKISLLKIHLLLWCFKDKSRQANLLNSISNDCEESIGLWTIDIKNNSVLTFMINDKLCSFDGKKYLLTDIGSKFVKNIIKLDIFNVEQEFLKNIGKKLTDKNVDKLKSLWS